MSDDSDLITGTNETMARRIAKEWGYIESASVVESTGSWTVEDAAWNYFDVPHLDVVHTQVESEALFRGHRATAAVIRQRVGPLKFGALLVVYEVPSGIAYSSTVGPFILLVDSSWRANDGGGCTVTTCYRVLAPRGLGWLLPLVHRLLRRNYEILMSEDLPMRERRAELRRRGYRFDTDGEQPSFVRSCEVRKNRVVAPDLAQHTWTIMLDQVDQRGEVLLGTDDMTGVRVIPAETELLVFPRICRHEGACLDQTVPRNGLLTCPWHARVEGPLARIPRPDENHETSWRVKVTVAEGYVTEARIEPATL